MSGRRAGFTLLELLVALAILATLVGLLVPAVQRVRLAAAATRQRNQIKQIALALHAYASTNGDRLPGRQNDPTYSGANPFMFILPHLDVPGPHWGTDENGGWVVATPTLYSSVDPSLHADPQIGGGTDHAVKRYGPASFALCTPGFTGTPALASSYPDGTSSTIAVSERYFICGKRANVLIYSGAMPNVHFSPAARLDPMFESWLSGSRSASFADNLWDDVAPVKSATGGPTVASVRGATFQHMPRVEDADGRQPQAFLPGGLTVALFDGSARTLRPGVAEAVFWAMTTPDGGEVHVD